MEAIPGTMDNISNTVSHYVANQTLNQRNAIIIAAALIPFGIYLGVKHLRLSNVASLAVDISTRIEVISTEEQIIKTVKQTLAQQQEKAAPIVVTFTAAQLALGATAFIAITAVAYLIYLRNKDSKNKLTKRNY